MKFLSINSEKNHQLSLPKDDIKAFCLRWKITEFALFGSVLRDDFRPDSDLDVLVTFSEEAPWGLLHLIQMEEELETLLGITIDLVEKKSIENSYNWLRKKEILSTMKIFYESR
jgi:uncharacterized protein